MDKDYFIKLTLGIYRVTELFPGEEPLKFKIREKANDILANLVLIAERKAGLVKVEDFLQNLEIMFSYFKVAKAQNWVDSRNFEVLEKEYEKIAEEIESKEERRNNNQALVKSSSAEIIMPLTSGRLGNFLSVRQEKILEILKHQNKTTAGELKKEFPEVSRRTLQRDLETLVSENLLNRGGEHNNVFYQFKA